MADRVVVYSVGTDAAAVGEVAARLRARHIEIVEEQPHMLLVSGTKDLVGQALGDIHGWKLTEQTTVPPPRTRYRVVKPPS